MNLKVWIDIDNAPQARYLLPFVHHFEKARHHVVVTARAAGDTLAILRSEGAAFEPIGSSFGKGIPRKLYGLAKRTRQLSAFLERRPAFPDLLLSGSRSAVLAARRSGIPSFVIVDYEHVNLLVYRISKSYVMHPRVIEARVFEHRGLAAEQLIAFDGLKEDFTFAEVDFSDVSAQKFGNADGSAPRVLFRPPAEESHYYRSESRELAVELLRYLAKEGARIVFSPRYMRQVGYLDEVPSWKEEPTVLFDPVPLVPLLTGVDIVVSAGGTMLREAAYLGVPAYSIFRSRIGAVDRYLASVGRLFLLASPADFPRIELKRMVSISPLRTHSTAVDEVISMMVKRTLPRTRGSRPSAFGSLRGQV